MKIKSDYGDLDIENPEEVLVVLKQGRELLSDPNHWIKGREAEAVSGAKVVPNSPLAVSWCAVGAIKAQVLDYSRDTVHDALQVLGESLPKSSHRKHWYTTTRFNDDIRTTHRQIMNLFDRSIKKLLKGNL